MEREIEKIKGGTQQNIMIHMVAKKKSQEVISRTELDLVGRHSRYNGTDDLNYHHMACYAVDALFSHIKFLEQLWNEYDDMKYSM